MPSKVVLYNQIDDKRVEVAAEEAEGLIKSGAYLVPENHEFTVVDSWGQKFGARGGDVYKWLAESNYRLETSSEEHQRYLDENYGGVGGAAAAGLLGAARGVTLGLSDLAAEAVGVGDIVADVAEASPGISLAGELTGAIAPALVTGGASTAATATSVGGRMAARVLAKTPAALAIKGGAATAHAVESAIRGGTTLEKGAALIGRAAGMAAEGAMFSGGAAMSERLLGDPEASASDILADMASGAVTGGVVGGALGFAFGVRTVTRKMEKALEAPTQVSEDGFQSMLEEVTGRSLAPEAVSTFTQLTNKMRKAAFVMKHGRANKKQADVYMEMVEKPLTRAAAAMESTAEKALDDMLPKIQVADKAFKDAIFAEGMAKSDRVARVAADVSPMSTGAAMERFIKPINSVKSVMKQVAGMADEVGHNVVRQELKGAMKAVAKIEGEFLEELGKAGEGQAGQVAMRYVDRALEEVNRSARRWRKTTQFVERTEAYLTPLDKARELARDLLTDENMWGAKAAGAMREMRHASSGAIHYGSITSKQFKAKTVSDANQILREWNPASIKAVLKKIGDDPSQNLKVRNLTEYFNAARHQLETNMRLLNLAPEEAALYKAAIKELDGVTTGFNNWKKVAKIQSDYKLLSKMSGAESVRTGGLGRMAGRLGLAAASPTAAAGMWLAGAAMDTVSKPAAYIMKLDQLHASRMAMRGKISNAARGILGRAPIGPVVGTLAASARPDTGRKEATPQELLEGIQQVSASGDNVLSTLQEQFGPVRELAPQTTAEMAKIQKKGADFLTAEAARLGLQGRPGRFIRPPQAKMDEWMRLYRSATNPVDGILVPLARGHLSLESEKVLREVWPQLAAALRESIYEELEKRPTLDISTAKKLSRILGIPLDDALSPDVVRILQNTQSVLNPSDQGMAPSSGRPGAADLNLTTAQRLEAK